jgi:nitric oxide reductase activation protein
MIAQKVNTKQWQPAIYARLSNEDEDAKKGKKLLRRKLKARKVKMIGEPWHYHEWDFRSQSDTPDWVTLRELTTPPGDVQVINDIITRNIHLASRMKAILNAVRYGTPSRIRKLEEGDEVDVNAAIRAQIDIKMGRQHDPRIMMRSMRKDRDISVLVLLDLSRSMNLKVEGQEQAAIDLMREVCALFSYALNAVGDEFAIHGFCSESRHYVEYFRLKDFGQSYDDTPKARLAGMMGNRSTRIGAGIRHATHYLNEQKSSKKLLMVVTDGAPTDIDVSSPHYLIFDAKHAVEDAGRDGINTYCIGLDPDADRYISRIFSAKNYIVVDHVKNLPEKMLMLYARLTR